MERHFDANTDEWVVIDSQGTEIYRVAASVARQVATMLQGDTPCLAAALKQDEPSRGPFPTSDWMKRSRPGVQPTYKSVVYPNGRVVIEPINSSEAASRHSVSKQPIESEPDMGKKKMTDALKDPLTSPRPVPVPDEFDLDSLTGVPVGKMMSILQPDESSKRGTTWSYGCYDGDYSDWE